MSENVKHQGFCYMAKNGYGKELLIAGSFAKSKTKAKRRLGGINKLMGDAHRPMLEPTRLVKVEVTVLEEVVE